MSAYFRKRGLRKWLRALLILAAVFVGFRLLAYLACDYLLMQTGWPSESRDVPQYLPIRAQFSKEMVAHFPDQIPSEAINAQLSYLPGFLQAGTEFQVAFELPPDKIGIILMESRKKAKAIYEGPGGGMDYVNKLGGYPVPLYKFGPGDSLDFPSGFLIFVIDAAPYHPGNWNHGYSCGLAVDESAHKVVYWAEVW